MEAIFEYFDYRAFLRDYYLYKKSRNRNFSYRSFARKGDIKSPIFFKEVAEDNPENATVGNSTGGVRKVLIAR
jgi:uncharacterized protein (TIGR02147 family)